MSETKWTPEPWWTNDFVSPIDKTISVFAWVTAANGSRFTKDVVRVSAPYAHISLEQQRANAERVATCVNACAGIPDPAAEIERLRRVEVAAKEVREKWTAEWTVKCPLTLAIVELILTLDKEPANG